MDTRPNLQTNQSFEGNEVNDKNGWPTPLVNPGGTLKVKIEDGSRGTQHNFKAMTTSRQGDVGKPESDRSVSGNEIDGLTINIKKTVGNSLGGK